MQLEDMFYIPENDWYKLQAWAKLAHDEDQNEISGLLTAVPQKDGRFKLSDIEILKQENTGTNTELDKDSVAQYTMKYGMKYNNPEMKFVWWHSHHTMAAFWSGTDENEINAWENNSFSLALVINLKEEYKFRVSVWKANGLPMAEHYDTCLTIERKHPKINITEAMKKKYEELCSSPTTIVNRHNYTYGTNVNQRHIWQREKALSIEDSYQQLLKKAESMQDSVVDGTLKFMDYHKEVKACNKICKKEKLPFSLKIFKGNTHELQTKLMITMPDELIEFEDNAIKDRIETIAWNNNFGNGGWY